MKRRLKDERGISLVIVLMVMAILLPVIGAGLIFSGVNTKITTNYQTGTKAFNAADTGVNAALTQLAMDQTAAVAAIAVTQVPGTTSYYQSESIQFKGTMSDPGYSLGVGTGYNQSGYGFYQYQINIRGYVKPGSTELATRRVEAQGAYGPVPK